MKIHIQITMKRKAKHPPPGNIQRCTRAGSSGGVTVSYKDSLLGQMSHTGQDNGLFCTAVIREVRFRTFAAF